MADPVTRVVVRLVARANAVDRLKPVLFELADRSRKEDGCNAYKVFQSQNDPLEFICYESWANSTAQEAHMTSPHVQAAFEKGLPLLAAPPDQRVYTTIY